MADMSADYRILLSEEWKRRKEKNPRYSLRAYAKFLRVDPGFLSKLFSGKKLLSIDLADSIAKRLKLTGKARAQFLISAAEEQKCHALYLIDPTLTDCDPALDELNCQPSKVSLRDLRA